MHKQDPLDVSVIVADDHEFFRQGVVTSLKTMRFVSRIKEATNGKEVIEILEKQLFKIVLMDINMPSMNGETATKIIRKKFPSVKVIALTMYEDESHIMDMVNAGVNGYVLKNTNRKELERAVRMAIAGKSYHSAGVADILLPNLVKKNNDENVAKEKDKLSDREIQILRMIYQEMTSREIAEKLFLSEKTVETHRNNILRKTNSRNTVGLMKYALRSGLCMD